MRTLGPRSVSSVLKILLDISYMVISLALVLTGILAMLSAATFNNPTVLAGWRWPGGPSLLAHSPRGALGMLTLSLNLLGLMAIVGRLRKIFVTLVAGQPFIPENARRLRVIGLVLAALEICQYAAWMVGNLTHIGVRFPQLDITGLFGIGVMFLLAEVFDEGARMRRDLDLVV